MLIIALKCLLPCNVNVVRFYVDNVITLFLFSGAINPDVTTSGGILHIY